MFEIESLRATVRGEVFAPEDPGFDRSHLGFNLAEAHRPDVVVNAAAAEDVATAVRFAVERGLPIRVQATGHGIGTPMDGGLLLTTGAMRHVTVDPEKRTADAAAGAHWEDVIPAAGAHHLATLCGSSPTVGVIGYTLGGGMGPMARTFGFASDRVRQLQLVDAGGDLHTITPNADPELFWALRGGKPDVGIVTALEFDLLDLPTYYGGGIFFAGDYADKVLHTFIQWAPTLPESVSTSIALLRLPDVPEVPEPLRGRCTVHLRYVHIGDPKRGAELLAPMRAVSPVIIDLVDTNPAAAIASVHQDPTDPMPARDEAMLLGDLTPQAVDALLEVAGPDVDVPLVIAELRLMGGAVARAGEYESAVGGRTGVYNACVIAPYPQQVRSAWSEPVRKRLDDIKHAWDPRGAFRFAYSATLPH